MLKKLLKKLFERTLRDVFINGLAASGMFTRSIRILVYRAYGIKTKTKKIRAGCFFDTNDVVIGENTFINRGCYFTNGPIRIGNNCTIAYHVMLCPTTHHLGSSEKRAGEYCCAPVILKDGCWIGARALILPGVTIGEGCVVAAGAVVTKDCMPNGLYAGVPAKRIKELSS